MKLRSQVVRVSTGEMDYLIEWAKLASRKRRIGRGSAYQRLYAALKKTGGTAVVWGEAWRWATAAELGGEQ